MRHFEKIDLHMHTVISDGTDSLEEIIVKLKEKGIRLFSVTDHDAIAASKIVPGLRREGDPEFIPGVEFSCQDKEGKYHILGYSYDPESPDIQAIVDKSHNLRMNKVTKRLDLLKEEFGFDFRAEDIRKLLEMANPGKPHIGNLMVKYGYAASKEEAIREFIDKLHFRNEHVRPEEAIDSIIAAGGIPVLAHPFFGDGGQLILGDEMEERLIRLMGFGIQGVEAFYSGFSPRMTNQMLGMADKHGLYVTAGSDYHGSNKLVTLGDNNLNDMDEEDWPEGLKRFLEKVI